MNEKMNNTKFRTQIVQTNCKAKSWTKFRTFEIPTKPKQNQTCGNNTRAIETLMPFALADKLRELCRKLGAWFQRPHPLMRSDIQSRCRCTLPAAMLNLCHWNHRSYKIRHWKCFCAHVDDLFTDKSLDFAPPSSEILFPHVCFCLGFVGISEL